MENFKSLYNNASKILVIKMIGVTLLIQVFLSYNLWFDNQSIFPKVPLFNLSFLESALLSRITSILFFVSILSLIFVNKSNYKIVITSFLFISLLIVTQDLNRLQVWIYFYTLIFLNVLFTDNKNETQFFNNQRVILGSVYFWSGLYKLNIHYVETFQWLVSEIKILNNVYQIETIAFISALIEFSLGVLIIINKSKKIVFFSILFMHSFIMFNLYLLDWNAIVYPWNVLMILLVYFSFYKTDSTNPLDFKKQIWVIVISMLPVLYFFNWIPSTFSFCMYSGRESSATLVFNSKKSKLQILESAIGDQEIIGVDLDYWSSVDKNVPVFADDFYFRKMNKILCQKYSELGYLGLIINKNPIQSKQYKIKCPCE